MVTSTKRKQLKKVVLAQVIKSVLLTDTVVAFPGTQLLGMCRNPL